ncbi:hypothetical protein CBR_g11151 [Chara braunii]|uniref:RRM domain-containing protein n=1 Tax=Chara braunii TaxID=69332 RepID=A0A388KQ92_CHABU|nr:hypothetical protein CBR_g11151 [Chara braunii]|eukprot:GBG72219.1 hypothetical protein CBR_g11151 [Chara braunii]
MDPGTFFSPQGMGMGYQPQLAASFFAPRTFPVVKLRGLPFNCNENDVIDFFAGLDVVDVLLSHKGGRFSGEAFVVFGAPMQVDFALQRNRQNMGRRYIEVFRSKKTDYYSAVAAEVSESQSENHHPSAAPGTLPVGAVSSRPPGPDKEQMEHTGVLKLRGLPFSASKRDIMNFFQDFSLVEDNIHIVLHSDGRATGEAYVEFSGPEVSKSAMCKDRMMLGNRYLELFPSSREEATRDATRDATRTKM